MALPFPANSTCDIYHGASTPPAAPDVEAVNFYLLPAFARGKEASEGSEGDQFTHVGYFEPDEDIRDSWPPGVGSGGSTCYVPDKNGVGYEIIFIEGVRTGAQSHKRAFLRRGAVTWPFDEI